MADFAVGDWFLAEEGDLLEDADSATLAAFVLAVSHGIAVQPKPDFLKKNCCW